MFHDNTNAGTATIFNAGGAIGDRSAGVGNGQLFFVDASSAGAATITNGGATAPDEYGGITNFAGTTAGNATIINEAGTGGNFAGYTEFYNQDTGADAGSATIINRAPTSGNFGGFTIFFGSSAGTSTITAEGSAVAGESHVEFRGSTAANGTLTALGATAVDGLGGRVSFFGGSADNATLIAESGTVPGAPGGRFIFTLGADGGAARATINAGGTFDISGLGAASAGMSIGSIEGDGTFFLGSKSLNVGGNGADTTVSGVISDGGITAGIGGSLIKSGAGTLTLSGANTFTGVTTVNGGTLAVNGSIFGAVTVNGGATLQGTGSVGGLVTVASGGTLSPGNSPGTLTMGALTLNNGSITQIELAGTTVGAQYDQLSVTGQLSLGGTLNVALIDIAAGLFAPNSGDSFEILDWGTLSGTFDTIQLPALASTLAWDTSQLYITGVLSVVSGLPGDYSNNGVVDAADFVLWRKNDNTSVTLPNDLTAGTDASDYDVWRAHFGQSAAGSGSRATTGLPSSAVPEPATVTLLLLVFVIAGATRRRDRARGPADR